MPSPPATPAPRAASCFATEAVRQGRPEPPLPPFQPHPSPRLRQIKGGGLRRPQQRQPLPLLLVLRRKPCGKVGPNRRCHRFNPTHPQGSAKSKAEASNHINRPGRKNF